MTDTPLSGAATPSPATSSDAATSSDPTSPAATDGQPAAPAPSAPAPAEPAAAPQTDTSSSPSSVAVGDVVRLAPNEDDPDAADRHVLVVGTVEGTDHRPDGALVIALPEARWVALDELASN